MSAGCFWRIEKSVNLCVCLFSLQTATTSFSLFFLFTPSSSFLRSIFILALFSHFGRCWWLLSKSQSSILSIAFLWLLFVLVYLNKFQAREEWRHMPSWSTFLLSLSLSPSLLFSFSILFHLSSVRCDEYHDPSAATHPVASISSTGTSVVGEIRGWCRNHYIYAQIYTYIHSIGIYTWNKIFPLKMLSLISLFSLSAQLLFHFHSTCAFVRFHFHVWDIISWLFEYFSSILEIVQQWQ